MRNLKKLTLTLVALFAMTTGAWAQNTVTWTQADLSGINLVSGQSTTISGVKLTANNGSVYIDGAGALFFNGGNNEGFTFSVAEGSITQIVITASMFGVSAAGWTEDGTQATWTGNAKSVNFGTAVLGVTSIEFTISGGNSAGAALTPDATRKVWTLDAMPAGNVELQVVYFPGMLTLPAKTAEGSIEVVGLGAATLPAGFDTDGTNLYVEPKTQFQVKAVPAEGYHLVSLSDGTNTYDVDADGIATVTMPEGDADLTLTATFSDQFELTFDDVNFKTNQNITVKVGDAEKTLDQDGKLSVKSGQTVTLTAKQGYKFRSVEAKKAGEPAATFVTGAVNANNLKVGDILKDVTSISGTGYFTLAENRYKENGTKQPYGAALEVGQIKTFSGYTITTTWDAVMTPIDDKGQDGNAWIVTGNDGNGPVVAGYTVTGN